MPKYDNRKLLSLNVNIMNVQNYDCILKNTTVFFKKTIFLIKKFQQQHEGLMGGLNQRCDIWKAMSASFETAESDRHSHMTLRHPNRIARTSERHSLAHRDMPAMCL